MRVPKVIIDFNKYTDSGLDQKAQQIVLAMTGNANFTTPSPALASVTSANNAYQIALANAANGGEAETAIKDEKREALEALLRPLGLYVEVESHGNLAIMTSSGFDISKQPSPVGPLAKPEDFKIESKGKGEIQLSIKKVAGAKSYQWEYKKVTDTAWIIATTTAAKLLLTALESGKEYNFKVVPIGASNVREYGDEVNSFVL